MWGLPNSNDARLLVRAPWPWRLALFAALVVVIVSLQQLFESWLLPTSAAELAVNQLRPSNFAAESLRGFEWVRHALPLVVWGLVAATGLLLFVPLPRPVRRWLRRVVN